MLQVNTLLFTALSDPLVAESKNIYVTIDRSDQKNSSLVIEDDGFCRSKDFILSDYAVIGFNKRNDNKYTVKE